MIRKVLFTILIFIPLLFISAQYTWSQVPKTITYQGILTQSNGAVVSNGNYSITFNLYAESSNGTTLWSETQNVGVEKGIFNVILGSKSPIALPFDKQYYLGITVGSGTEMTPRIQLTSSAYSFHSSIADSLTGKSKITSDNIASEQVVKSINTLKDSVTIIAGTNVSITPSGNTLTIASSGGGGGTITGITAGTGMSGGGTSGNVTINAAVPFILSGNSSQAIISGTNSNSNSFSSGVSGASPSGYGIYGTSTTGYAIYANGNLHVTGTSTGSGNSTITGTNATTVKLSNDAQVQFYCEEAAEVYFTYYGEGTLVDGGMRVELDPTFLQTVTIDTRHPLMVFLQLEGDCKGAYVTNKTATSFDVIELQGGRSTAPFTYRVVCKRKYYEDERMATVQQAALNTQRMMQAVWPEVIEKEKTEQEK